MSNKAKKIIAIVIMVFIFLFIYLLNYKTFLVSDDYPYQFVFTGRVPNNGTKLISNPLDIFIFFILLLPTSTFDLLYYKNCLFV